MFAAKAGARHVYAVDCSGIIELARCVGVRERGRGRERRRQRESVCVYAVDCSGIIELAMCVCVRERESVCE